MGAANGTYVKMFRKIVNWEWYKVPNTCRLYEHLIYKANYDDNTIRNIIVKSGQRMTSLDSLVHETGLSRQQIRTALKNLESTHDITQQVTHHYRIITICNYKSYQIENDDSNTLTNTQPNKPSTHQLTPIKEVKNYNKDNNIYIYIFDFWNSKEIIEHKNMNTLKSGTSKYKNIVDNLTKSGDTKEAIILSIESYNHILKSDEFYFNFKWTLCEFLVRGFEKFKDFDIASNNYKKNDQIRKATNEVNQEDYAKIDRFLEATKKP